MSLPHWICWPLGPPAHHAHRAAHHMARIGHHVARHAPRTLARHPIRWLCVAMAAGGSIGGSAIALAPSRAPNPLSYVAQAGGNLPFGQQGLPPGSGPAGAGLLLPSLPLAIETPPFSVPLPAEMPPAPVSPFIPLPAQRPQPVPEPSSLWLFPAALAAMVLGLLLRKES